MKTLDKLLYRSSGWLKVLTWLLVCALIFGSLALVSYLLTLRLPEGARGDWFWDTMSYFADLGNAADSGEGMHVWAYIVGLAGSVILSGLLVSMLLNIFDERVRRVEEGEARYKLKDHYIIIGFNDLTLSVIAQLKGQSCPILLQTSRDVASVNARLFGALDKKTLDRMVVYAADRDNVAEIASLYVERARYIYVLGDDEPNGDALNTACVRLIGQHLSSLTSKERQEGKEEAARRVPCIAVYKHTFSIASLEDKLAYYPVNYYDLFSKELLVDRNILVSDEGVHFVIIGMSEMGMSLGKMASMVAHYPNGKSLITFIAADADKRSQIFRNRYPHFFDVQDGRYSYLGNFVDVAIEFKQADIHSSASRRYLVEQSRSGKLIIAVAVEDEIEAREIATYLPPELSAQHVPVYVYQPHSELAGQGFGTHDKGFSLDEDIFTKAKQLNYAYALFYGATDTNPEKEWWKLDYALQVSNTYAVYHLPIRRALAQHVSSRELAEVEHNRWVVEKLFSGYRPLTEEERKTYQPAQKKALKEQHIHRDLCAYTDLEEDDSGKDVRQLDELINQII